MKSPKDRAIKRSPRVRRIGRIKVSLPVLEKMMAFPAGHHISAVIPQSADDVVNQVLDIIVTGPTLPAHLEGTPVTVVDLIVSERGGRLQGSFA